MNTCPPCDSENPTSVLVKIGGAQIKVFCVITWQYQIKKKGESNWGSSANPQDVWETETSVIEGADGTQETTSRCCITIVTTASALGLPVIPPGYTGAGQTKVAYEVTTHASPDATGPAVDTAKGGYIKY